VYSHLEPANFVASIGQYLIKAKTYLCRHHIDEGRLYHFDKDLSYRMTYKLAKHIIVVSDHSKRYMIDQEKIHPSKILHINLAYDFSLYEKQRKLNVAEIRDQYRAEVLLLSACRMTSFKRPEKVIEVARRLLDQGLDVKLIMLGSGEMQDELEMLIKNLGLNDRIFMLGYVSNVLDYMAAANFLLHPSLLDSSCVAIKEAGLVELPVIVCKGIGDFDDYLIDGENGFVVSPDFFIEEASQVVKNNFQNVELLHCIGERLNKSVLDLFSIEHVLVKYDSLNNLPS
jgi:glycosyltransferase involved in cell wall biosynthesis